MPGPRGRRRPSRPEPVAPEDAAAAASAGEPREVASEPFDYSLVRLADDRLVLKVVANQSAFYYMKEHELTPSEVEAYRTRGMEYLEQLARRVRYGS